MIPNPYYDQSLEEDCRQYMIISIKMWLKYIEKYPDAVPISFVEPINIILDKIDNFDSNTQTREIALLYEEFVSNFNYNPETIEKLFKLPILFLIPEIK